MRTLKEDRDLLLNLTPAAELSWGLLMACARKLPSAFDHVKSGQWDREQFPGIMLRGKRMGIIGCGRLGGWVGRYALAFGMEVLGYDPYVDPLPDGFTRVTLEELVCTSDFISVHVHLSEETRGLVSRKYFEMMKPGIVFINTSRGAVIDETAHANYHKKTCESKVTTSHYVLEDYQIPMWKDDCVHGLPNNVKKFTITKKIVEE